MASRHYTEQDSHGAASKFGQMIGEAFENVVAEMITTYLEEAHSEYELLSPEEGRTSVTIDMLGGSSRQMDTILAAKNSTDPVALLETKWLKDARHHNDKGAWILQLREVKKRHATIRGAAAILAGYWTEGVGVMLQSEGGITMVLVATDDEVYGSLQEPLNEFLGDDSFAMDARTMRNSVIRPWDLANFLIYLDEEGKLVELARSWLTFERGRDEASEIITGGHKIKLAIDKLLAPLPETPRIDKFEIALQIDSGNVIYEAFSDIEDALDFIQTYFNDSNAILQRITPKKNS